MATAEISNGCSSIITIIIILVKINNIDYKDSVCEMCDFCILYTYLKVAGKQKIGSLTVFFPVVCIKKSYFFIYNVAMALLYMFLS